MNRWSKIFLLILLWAVRQFLLPVNTYLADALLVTGPFFIGWRRGFSDVALVFIGASLLVDAVTFYYWPVYFIVACLTWLVYKILIQDYLADSSILGQLINLVGWLILWRGWRVVLLLLAWKMAWPGFVSLQFDWWSWFSWLTAGLTWWLIFNAFSWWRQRHRRSLYYAQ